LEELVEQVTGQKEKKKKKLEKECPTGVSGYDQMKDESLCTTKLQTYEKFS